MVVPLNYCAHGQHTFRSPRVGHYTNSGIYTQDPICPGLGRARRGPSCPCGHIGDKQAAESSLPWGMESGGMDTPVLHRQALREQQTGGEDTRQKL